MTTESVFGDLFLLLQVLCFKLIPLLLQKQTFV